MAARRRLLLGLLLLAGLAGAALLGGKLWAEDLAARITARTGATLTLAAPEAARAAGQAIDPRITGTAPGPLKGRLALHALDQALALYPEALLRQMAPKLLITGELRLAGYRIGGTTQPGMVLLASDYLLRDAGPSYTRRAFHHEFSSLLIARHPFPVAQWQAELPADFAFPISAEAQLAATSQTVPPEELPRYHAAGFVSDYGASSLENDINTYAELLLDAPETLARLAASSPRIANKTKLIQAYYTALAPGLAAHFTQAGLPPP